MATEEVIVAANCVYLVCRARGEGPQGTRNGTATLMHHRPDISVHCQRLRASSWLLVEVFFDPGDRFHHSLSPARRTGDFLGGEPPSQQVRCHRATGCVQHQGPSSSAGQKTASTSTRIQELVTLDEQISRVVVISHSCRAPCSSHSRTSSVPATLEALLPANGRT